MNNSPGSAPNYLQIVSHYEACLAKYGDTCLGVDWPNQIDANTRYKIMLDIVRKKPDYQESLLDFGCGTSHLYEYMLSQGLNDLVDYAGLDVSEKYIQVSSQKFPQVKYYCLDILKDAHILPDFDYVVMNGVFTEKCNLTFDEMWSYFKRVMLTIFAKARVGIAFNVMSKQVDWERDDLFHVPFDLLAAFLKEEISRHFVFRQEYGLYEYTTYVYRRPVTDI